MFLVLACLLLLLFPVTGFASLLPAGAFDGITADVTAAGTGILTVGIIIVGVALLMKAFR